MERIDIEKKDVIIHRDMAPEEREKELQKLKEESNQLKEWEEQALLLMMMGSAYFICENQGSRF